MPVDLIELLTNELSGRAPAIAAALAEPESETRAALAALALALVVALVRKGSTPFGVAELLDMAPRGGIQLRQPPPDARPAAELTNLAVRGAPLMTRLFDGRQGQVAEWLASTSGIRARSATSLLSLGAPLLLGLMANAAERAGGFDGGGVCMVLLNQRAVMDDTPYELAGALGTAGTSAAESPAPRARWRSGTACLLLLLLVPIALLLSRWWASWL